MRKRTLIMLLWVLIGMYLGFAVFGFTNIAIDLYNNLEVPKDRYNSVSIDILYTICISIYIQFLKKCN